MQSYTKIQSILIILIVLAFVVTLTNNNAFAQSLHDKTLYNMINQTLNSVINSHIDVGDTPIDIAINKLENIVYVANGGSDSVSVISGENNIKIKDIPVGDLPTDIAINENTNTVYVINSDDSVSVISGENNTKIKDIPVGHYPRDIAINENTNTVYVVNLLSGSVSVISGENNTKIKDIPVGTMPEGIAINKFRNIIYVNNGISYGVAVISGENNTKIKDIPVGTGFRDIANNQESAKVYVANSDSSDLSGSVSVISGENNTKIGEDIPVGDLPTDIAINKETNTVYVVNLRSDSVSVISGENNTKIGEDIPVGDLPNDIAINENTNTVYVINLRSDSVSVISGENNIKIKDIPVGTEPSHIAINENTNTVYVIGSGSLYVIDGISNKIVAGVTFEIYPFNSGRIECDGLLVPVSQYFYVFDGTECIAKPNQGFEFQSWEENLNNNSTQLITVSHSVSTIFEDIMDSVHNIVNYLGIDNFFGISNSVESEAILNVIRFGTFTANFRELPAPIPSEYWIPLYGLIPGFFIPSIIKWLSGKRQRKNLREYLDKIGKVDRYIIEKEVLTSYSKGKISDFHYQMLKDKISQYYENTHIDK